MNTTRILCLSPLLLSASLLAGNLPPQPFGSLGALSRNAAEASKNVPGVVMLDAESNLLLRHARSLGFGAADAPGGNYVGNSQSRGLILQPGASFGYAGNVGANYAGKIANRTVQLVDHALRGNPGGATAKLNLAQDVASGRWTKDLIVLRPDGTKDEYRAWRGHVCKASASKMQLVDDQSLIAAAAHTGTNFLSKTIIPLASATSAFDEDLRLFTTLHAGVNLTCRALANFDAPMRDTDWFAGLASKDPGVAFLRQAARDDVRASATSIKDEVAKWRAMWPTKDEVGKWQEMCPNALKRIDSFLKSFFKWCCQPGCDF